MIIWFREITPWQELGWADSKYFIEQVEKLCGKDGYNYLLINLEEIPAGTTLPFGIKFNNADEALMFKIKFKYE